MFSPILYTAELSRFLRWQSSGDAFSNSHWVSTVRMRSVRLGLLRVKDGKEEEEDGAPLHWSLSSCWVHWGPQMQRLGTWGLWARCISAISWLSEPLTLTKRIYWFSALIGSDAPEWFYNTRWPHTWDLLAVNLKFTVLARLIGSDEFKCMRRFCRCIKQEIRSPLCAPGSPFYYDVSHLFSCVCWVSSLFISIFYPIRGVYAKSTPWNQCCDLQTIYEPFTQCCRKHDPTEWKWPLPLGNTVSMKAIWSAALLSYRW